MKLPLCLIPIVVVTIIGFLFIVYVPAGGDLISKKVDFVINFSILVFGAYAVSRDLKKFG
jgi:hypothetical protein